MAVACVVSDDGVVQVSRPQRGGGLRNRAVSDDGVVQVSRPQRGGGLRNRAVSDDGVVQVYRPQRGGGLRNRAVALQVAVYAERTLVVAPGERGGAGTGEGSREAAGQWGSGSEISLSFEF